MTSVASTQRPSPADSLVSVQGLTKRFPVEWDFFGRATAWVPAVEDVTIDVRRGETLALVGESGSGKSTLARLILRLIQATEGIVQFEQMNVFDLSRRDLTRFRTRAQIIFQDPFESLDPRMQGEAIVAEGMAHLGLAKHDRRKRVQDLLDIVQLPRDAADRFPHEFSGGQRQRLSIARALAVDPIFIIADEPVSALDVSMQSQILNLMRDLQRQLGLTYLFISHDMSVVRHMADRVSVMYLGKVVEIAPADELFSNPLHPYTQTLLSAVPSLLTGSTRRRIRVPGEAAAKPEERACLFAGRCFRSLDVCRSEIPPLELRSGSPDHWVACFNPADFSEIGKPQ
jgi:oligopeptide/dipeptide ABC transporter ATP-binding protein